MRKIPTVFVRDFTEPSNGRYVINEVTPGCEWVLAGEGVPTRKYDGTCVRLDGDGRWWARREVKAGKQPPADYIPEQFDEVTGKTVGWEPIEQSAFAKFHTEALANEYGVLDEWPTREPAPGATYELLGPKVNGNPEGVGHHMLVRHGYQAAVDRDEMDKLTWSAAAFAEPFDVLRDWLLAHERWEGIVWHHPDGRMAKLKRRDFSKANVVPAA